MDNEFLNDLEKEKIDYFNKDEVMKEAVKKVLLASIYHCGVQRKGKKSEPLKNPALAYAFNPQLTHEQIGAELRAFAQGVNMVENGFKDLEKYNKLVKGKENKNNPAL